LLPTSHVIFFFISEPNTIAGVSTKRTSIYYVGTKKTTGQCQPLPTKVLSSNRQMFGFDAKLGKKQVVWADQGTVSHIIFAIVILLSQK
jgi:hypothetical protein